MVLGVVSVILVGFHLLFGYDAFPVLHLLEFWLETRVGKTPSLPSRVPLMLVPASVGVIRVKTSWQPFHHCGLAWLGGIAR